MTSKERATPEVTFDLSIEEIVVLADATGATIPPPLGPSPLGIERAETRAARLETARRGLAARHLIDLSAGVVVSPVAKLLDLFARPAVVVRVQREEGGRVRESSLCAGPGVAGELLELANGLWRFVVFQPGALPKRVAGRAGLVERPHDGDALVRLRPGAVPRIARLLGEDHDSAVSYLVESEGVEETAAERLTCALEARVASAIVTILWRPSGTVLEGGEVSWLDCGQRGLWLMPVPDPPSSSGDLLGTPIVTAFGEVRVEMQAVSAESILAELISYLPAVSQSLTSA